MDDVARKLLYRRLGEVVMAVQDDYRLRYHAVEVVPEIVAALLSLCAYVAKNNMFIEALDFERACEIARDEQWKRAISEGEFEE